MKKQFYLIAILAFSIIPSAVLSQTFGIKGGLNLSNMKISDDNSSRRFKTNPGFHIGPTAEIPISEILSFETGLILSSKGFKSSFNLMGYESKSSFNPLYLDIPLTAKASHTLNDIRIYGLLGPYIGFGVGGKGKEKITVDGETEKSSEKINWGSDEEDDFRRMDYGLVIGVGAEYQSFLFTIAYNMGLANLTKDNFEGAKTRNQAISFSVGYLILKK